jgi:hypothetical protein
MLFKTEFDHKTLVRENRSPQQVLEPAVTVFGSSVRAFHRTATAISARVMYDLLS